MTARKRRLASRRSASPRGAARGTRRTAGWGDDDDLPPLSPAQIRDLKRRVADSRDATRYMLVSKVLPGFLLYYNVSDHVYAMNNPPGGTLFKRRKTAMAVREFLRPGITVVRCSSRVKDGVRVPLLPEGWRPKRSWQAKGRRTRG